MTVQSEEAFIALLSSRTSQDYAFRTEAEVVAGCGKNTEFVVGNNLLGGVSEFAIYVIRMDHDKWSPPFIHSFKAKDPLGSVNYPLVDVSIFHVGTTSDADVLYVQEVKATRTDPGYFRECEMDFEGLYAKGRLASTIEHMKFDLDITNQKKLIPRINDCLGTCPSDSAKVSLTPTGVSGDDASSSDCIDTLGRIAKRLQKAGWPNVSGMYLRVPQIEAVYKKFATGAGAQDD